MSGFNSPQKTTAPAQDELDRKIGVMNNYLVEGRAELDKMAERKKSLGKEISELEIQLKDLLARATAGQIKVDALEGSKKQFGDDIVRIKNDIVLENAKLDNVKKEVASNEERVRSASAELDKREKDILDRESAMRVYAKSLEEKERKLDEYAEKVKRFVGQLKA